MKQGAARRERSTHGVHGQIGGGAGRVRSAVLDEVACHPVVFAAGQILYRLTVEMPVQFDAAFAGGADQSDRDSRIERLGDDRGLAVAESPSMPTFLASTRAFGSLQSSLPFG